MKSKVKSYGMVKNGVLKFKANVVRGDGRGRKIGFPTVNLEVKSFQKMEERFFMFFSNVTVNKSVNESARVSTDEPTNEAKNESAHGVYFVKADGMPAVMHFGSLPTFEKNMPRAEIHILDFEGDLYGREVEVEVFDKIREVKKFDSVEDLVAAIEKDVEKAREFFEIYT